MYNFDKNNFVIVRQAIDKKVADFSFNYFKNKKNVADYLFKYTNICSTIWGAYDDRQIPNTYCTYGDLVMDTLLDMCLPMIEQHTNKKVIPTYSYARLYKKGDKLERHKDRFSCEISTTLNLGDHWRDPFEGEICGQVFLHYNNKQTEGSEKNIYDGRAMLGLPKEFYGERSEQ